MALGEATKTVPVVQDGLKSYRFAVQWGVETDTDEHMRELDRLPADPSGDYTVQSGGRHRFTAPSSRGLGTASTAARSREESGCK